MRSNFKRIFPIPGIGSPIIINHEPVPAAGEECADVARLAVDVGGGGGGGGGACLGGVCLCDEDDAFEGEARLDAVGVVEAVAALAAREAGLLVNEIDLQGGRNYPGEEMWESLSSLDHILLSQKERKGFATRGAIVSWWRGQIFTSPPGGEASCDCIVAR